MRKITYIFSALCILLATTQVSAQSLELFEQNVTEHTLDNGLKVIVVKRDVAPVATFMTYVNVGGVDEPKGRTGIAHIFEHMAFKGTSRIGTNNWDAEKIVLDEVDATYSKWLREVRSPEPNMDRADSLLARFNDLEAEAKQYVNSNEFSQIIESAGGVGLNAGTSTDFTVYFYSLPQNKAELWFSLEAERFKDPVLREFYVEKDVVFEERRMRTDSSPIGRLLEEFLAVAYTALPYRDALIGWPSDIEATTIADALDFYKKYYVPSNMTIVIVGDVNPTQMIQFAESYFGDIPQGEPAPPMYVEEPPQRGERRFVIDDPSQPLFIMGYKGVGVNHPDALLIDLLAGVLFEGRSSRMQKVLVDEKKLALGMQGLTGYPGSKHTSLFLTFAIPNQDVAIEDLESAIDEELEKVKSDGITQEELDRVITSRRASLLRQLGNNTGIANLLSTAQGMQGDWRKVFTDIQKMQEVTVEDINRVANQYMNNNQRTVGIVRNNSTADAN
ncbi:MAG TPA: peptidase M16 [Bacteroidetes bacterium]|nr:peptidase M16 [Bacteroidota bacterium]